MGWTHRKKNKKVDPYLKIKTRTSTGATFVDMDQRFRWIAYDEVVEL